MTNKQDNVNFYQGIHEESYYSREEVAQLVTDDYIRGLIDGEGHFGADTRENGEKIPCFVLKMHVRDKELIEGIRDYLGLKNFVYEYKNQGRHFAVLIVRDIATLKNKIVPLFKKRLLGYKGTQFQWWLKRFPYLNSLTHREDNII